ERDQRRRALDPSLDQLVVDEREPGEVLVLLAVGHLDRDRREAGARERVAGAAPVEAMDRRIGDDRDALRDLAERLEARAERVEHAVADVDRVRARAEADDDGRRVAHRVAALPGARPAATRGAGAGVDAGPPGRRRSRAVPRSAFASAATISSATCSTVRALVSTAHGMRA